MGYALSGFDVTGVDIARQPRYPFKFIQADALDYLAHADLSGYDLIHASPPCQRYSVTMNFFGREHAQAHPDLIPPVRELLDSTGRPYVIENVPGSPLRPDLILCGCYFDLSVVYHGVHFVSKRPRIFEFGQWHPDHVPEFEHDHAPYARALAETGTFRRTAGFYVPDEIRRLIIGVPWARNKEHRQAIPPAFTECIGELFISQSGASVHSAVAWPAL